MTNFDRNKPYNKLPLLPPKIELETKEILKKAISANKELASMAAFCKQLPNESIFYSSVFLKEAKDSSEIENIVTTNDELYQALAANKAPSDPNTREVLHYIDALWDGLKEMKSTQLITSRTFVKIANTIKENNEGIRAHSGTKIQNKRTKEIIYTPPEGKSIIEDKLKNLEQYINTDDGIDPLVKMAVIHYQFEAIHPFSDGNGRTGRIINVLYLVLQNLVDHPMLFLSKYIIGNKNDYYIKLKEVTEEGKWQEWILYMLQGIEETSIYTRKKVAAILELMKTLKYRIRGEAPEIYSKDLLEVLFQQPYCKVQFLEDAGIVKRITAGKYLNKLTEMGILKKEKIGKENLYVNKEFYNILKS